MYIRRHLEQEIIKASQQFPIVMLTGARQTGKSTMLMHIKEENRSYVSLKDMRYKKLAKEDPSLFFQTVGERLIIDEFQEVPSLLDEIFNIVETKKLNGEEYRGLFWLTGSQKFKMLEGVSQSLAGRVAVFEMLPLSTQEIENKEHWQFTGDISTLSLRSKSESVKSLREVFDNIFTGFMPDVVANKIDRDLYYSSYVNTYLERDVKNLIQGGMMSKFYDFLVCIASQIGCELKYDKISNNISVSAPTIKNWVSILEKSGILYILHPYFNNISKRLVKAPKLYFTDTGLAAYLTSWPSSRTLEAGNMAGEYLENYVVMEIVKSFVNSTKRPNIYYYRDIDKREIDLLIQSGEALYPVEIKKAAFPQDADKNYPAIQKFGTIKPLVVVCFSDKFIPLKPTAYLCPVGVL